MNAIQRPKLPVQPTQERRVSPRKKRHLRQRSYQVMALESTAKIGVNLMISTVAISALIHLIPYSLLQQQKLSGVLTEVKLTETRVNSLQAEFSRSFDPKQAKSIMEQQGYRLDPSQHQVVLMNKDEKEPEQPSSSP